MVHAFAAVGTYDEIAGVIKLRFAGVNRLSFDMPVKNDRERGFPRGSSRTCAVDCGHHAGGGLMSAHRRRISSICVSTAHSVSTAALSGIARKIEPALESP